MYIGSVEIFLNKSCSKDIDILFVLERSCHIYLFIM